VIKALNELEVITLFVEDLPAVKTFYTNVFGLEVISEDNESAVLKLKNVMINLLVAFAAHDLIAPASVAAESIGVRSLLTVNVTDADAVISELEQHGVKMINGPVDQRWDRRTAAFADPAGHVWEIAQVLSPGVRPQDNFLFTSIDDADHNHFNALISLVATTQIVLLAIAGFMSRPWRKLIPVAWWSLVGWGTATVVLMFSVSFPFYRILPEIRYVQLPLRWLLCLNVVFVLLITMASRRWTLRVLACLVMLAVLVWGWHRVLPPWWDNRADIAEMLDNQITGAGYEGTDEYVPKGADAYEINKDAPRVAVEGERGALVHVTQWSQESKAFTVNLREPGRVMPKLFNFPEWEVEVNGHAVKAETADVTGQMIIPVGAGENQVRIVFARTRDQAIGRFISFATVILLLGWKVREKRKPRLIAGS